MIRPTIIERDPSKQVVKPLKIGTTNAFTTIKPATTIRSDNIPPPPPQQQHQQHSQQTEATSTIKPLPDTAVYPEVSVNGSSNTTSAHSLNSAFEKELLKLLSPANIEFLKNRSQHFSSSSSSSSVSTINKSSIRDDDNASITKPPLSTNSLPTPALQKKSPINTVTAKPSRPVVDETVGNQAQVVQAQAQPQRSVNEKMEVFDFDGRKVIDVEAINKEMQLIFDKNRYESKFDKNLWTKATQIMIDELIRLDFVVEEADTSFSYEELLFLLRSRTNQHVILANRVLSGIMSRREWLCAWETYAGDVLPQQSTEEASKGQSVCAEIVESQWLNFPSAFETFCKSLQSVFDITTHSLLEVESKPEINQQVVERVSSHLLPKLLAYETMPNELPTALLWSMTLHSTTNPALIQSKLILLRQYLGNTIEREVSSAIESLPSLYYPCFQPSLINGQAWRPQLGYEQKNLNDRNNVESFVKSSNESKQQPQQQGLEQLTGITETEELAMLCRWARCDAFGKDQGLMQKLLGVIDMGIQQMLKSLSSIAVGQQHSGKYHDNMSVVSESSVVGAASDVLKANALLAMNILIDISLSCSIETKVFLVNTIASLTSSSGTIRSTLLSNMEKLVKHAVFQEASLDIEDDSIDSCLQMISLFYELFNHLIQGLRPNEIVLDRLWFFTSDVLPTAIAQSLPVVRSLFRFVRSVFHSFLLHSPTLSSTSSTDATQMNQQLVAIATDEVVSSLVKTTLSLHGVICSAMTFMTFASTDNEWYLKSIEIMSFLIAEQALLSQSMLKDLDSSLMEELEKRHCSNVRLVIDQQMCDSEHLWQMVSSSIPVGIESTFNRTHTIKKVYSSLVMLLLATSPNIEFKVSREDESNELPLIPESWRENNYKVLSTACPLNYHSLLNVVDEVSFVDNEKSVVPVNKSVFREIQDRLNQRMSSISSTDRSSGSRSGSSERNHSLLIFNQRNTQSLESCLFTEQWFAFTALLYRLGLHAKDIASTVNNNIWEETKYCRVSDGLFHWRRSQCLQQLLSHHLLTHMVMDVSDNSDSRKVVDGSIYIQTFLQYFQINSSPLALRWIRFVLEDLTLTTVFSQYNPLTAIPAWVNEMIDKMFLSLTKLKDVTIDANSDEGKPSKHKSNSKDALMYFTSLDLLAGQLPNLPLTPTWLCDLLLELTEVPHLLTWSTVLSQAITWQSSKPFSSGVSNKGVWPTASLLLTLCKLQLQLVHVYEEQGLENHDSVTDDRTTPADDDITGGIALEEIAKNCLHITTTLLLPFTTLRNQSNANDAMVATLSNERQTFRRLILEFEKKSAPTLQTLGRDTDSHVNKMNRQEQELLWAFGERLSVACLHSIIPFECQRFLVTLIFSPLTPTTVKRRFLQEVEYLNLFSFVQDFFNFGSTNNTNDASANEVHLCHLLLFPIQPSLWVLNQEDYMLTQDILHLFDAQSRYGSKGLIATNFGIYLMLLVVSLVFSSSTLTVTTEDNQRSKVIVSTWGKKILRILLTVMATQSQVANGNGSKRWIVAASVAYGEILRSSAQEEANSCFASIDSLIDDTRNRYDSLQVLGINMLNWEFFDEDGQKIDISL